MLPHQLPGGSSIISFYQIYYTKVQWKSQIKLSTCFLFLGKISVWLCQIAKNLYKSFWIIPAKCRKYWIYNCNKGPFACRRASERDKWIVWKNGVLGPSHILPRKAEAVGGNGRRFILKCAVIRDTLPLYADGCCSRETENLVVEHLANCAGSGNAYC